MEQGSALREHFARRPDLPVNYSFDYETRGSGHLTAAHWHEHMELLLVTQGVLRVNVQGSWVEAAPGELVVINAGEIHSIPEKAEDTLYACLIPHESLCRRMALPVEEWTVEHHIQDQEAVRTLHSILHSLKEKPLFYKTEVQARSLTLLIYLIRYHGCQRRENQQSAPSSRERMVKKAMTYIQENFKERISTEDICTWLGFEKSYVCSNFKAITGTTVLEYLNLMRCEHARELLRTGELSVSQCAAQSGFHHMSYFTKTYKRYMGQLPSRTAKAGTAPAP